MHMRCMQYWLLMFMLVFTANTLDADDLQQGIELAKKGNHDAAISILSKITDQAQAPQALLLMASCYKKQRNWSQVIECYQQLLEKYPNSVAPDKEVKIWIMDYYLADNNIHMGSNYLEQLCAEYPEDAHRFHYIAGRRYQWVHKYADAVKELREAVKLPNTNSNVKDAAKRLICCYLSAGNFDGALEYLSTYIKQYPDQIPNIMIGQTSRWDSRMPDAIQVIEETLHSMPASSSNSDAVRIGLAEFYVAIQDWDKASNHLVSIPKPFGNWYVLRAKCYHGEKEFDRAIETLKQAISLDNSIKLQRLLLEYYRDAGDWKSMLAQTQMLQKGWPDLMPEWRLNEGWAYLDMKEYVKAISVFRDIIKCYPGKRNVVRGAMISLGECLYKIDKGDEAMQELDKYYSSRPELNEEKKLVHAMILYHGPRDLAEAEEILRGLAGTSMANPAKLGLLRVLGAQDKWKENAELRLNMLNAIPDWSPWAKAKALEEVADSYYMGRHYKEAVEVYKEILKLKIIPTGLRCQVMLQTARCQKELGYQLSAKNYLSRIITDYPETYNAKQAEELLQVW